MKVPYLSGDVIEAIVSHSVRYECETHTHPEIPFDSPDFHTFED
jgi:hypothetical protein